MQTTMWKSSVEVRIATWNCWCTYRVHVQHIWWYCIVSFVCVTFNIKWLCELIDFEPTDQTWLSMTSTCKICVVEFQNSTNEFNDIRVKFRNSKFEMLTITCDLLNLEAYIAHVESQVCKFTFDMLSVGTKFDFQALDLEQSSYSTVFTKGGRWTHRSSRRFWQTTCCPE